MKVCVIQHKDGMQEIKSGKAARVKEDALISGIRGVKKIFRIAQNNELYVCENDYEKVVQKRKKFEKNVVFIIVLSVIIMLFLVGLPLLSGKFELGIFFSALFIGTLIILGGVIFKYSPVLGPLEEIKQAKSINVERIKKSKTKNKR